jgi:hypothetical protein
MASVQHPQQNNESKRAVGRSLTDFQNQDTRLPPPEEALVYAASKGTWCSFVDQKTLAALDEGKLNKSADEEACKKTPIRAEFIRFLALGGDRDLPVHENGIYLAGAFVTGTLSLYNCKVKVPIFLFGCLFEKKPDLRYARLRTTSLRGSRVPGFSASQSIIEGNLVLDRGFRSFGDQVDLRYANIRGDLICTAAEFINGSDDGRNLALDAVGAKIGGLVQLDQGFRAKGRVRFRSAEIGVDFDCASGTFINRTDDGKSLALDATAVKIGGFARLNTGFHAEGQVSLLNAEIAANLSCTAANIINLTANGEGSALDATGAQIGGQVVLNEGFVAKGRVSLRNTNMGTDLICTNGRFINQTADGKGSALDATGARIGGQAVLNEGFVAEGRVSLRNTDVETDLICTNGKFINQTADGNGSALDAAAAKIGGVALLDKGFSAKGQVRFRSAEIGVSLYCRSGTFINRTGDGKGIALDAAAAKIADIALDQGFRAEGQVYLRGTEIGVDLGCTSGTFINRTDDGKGVALDAIGVKIRGFVRLDTGFHAEGKVSLLNAEIGASLICAAGSIINLTASGEGIALEAIAATIGGFVLLSEGFVANGRVYLRNTNVGADLTCTNGKFINHTADGEGVALDAIGAQIGGHIFLNDGFLAEGRVFLFGANIAGDLSCIKATIKNRAADGKGWVLNAIGTKIGGSVWLSNGFVAEGQVLFSNAEIARSLDCRNGKIANRPNGEKAFDAVNAKIHGDVFLGAPDAVFVAEGAVVLDNVEIGGDLDCRNGQFTNFTTDGQAYALSAAGAHVGGNAIVGLGFKAQGKVSFLGARVDGQLACAGGLFHNPAPSLSYEQKVGDPPHRIAEIALQLQAIKVGDVLFLGPPDNLRKDNSKAKEGAEPQKAAESKSYANIEGSLSLEGAYVREFSDHPDKWPHGPIRANGGEELYCCIDLLNFKCERLIRSVPAKARLRWLRRQPPNESDGIFAAEPFANLVSVLREMGNDTDALTVAVAGESLRRREWYRVASRFRQLTLGPWKLLWGLLFGYGYRPQRAFYLLLMLWLGCAFFYSVAAREDAIAPSQPELFLDSKFQKCREAGGAWMKCATQVAPAYAEFNAFVYSADLMLPIVDLQQKRAWGPTQGPILIFGYPEPRWLLWLVVWFETIVGWVGSVVLAGVASRILIRGE